MGFKVYIDSFIIHSMISVHPIEFQDAEMNLGSSKKWLQVAEVNGPCVRCFME
jgi:hypothetical protein